jgi:hypothetical protein
VQLCLASRVDFASQSTHRLASERNVDAITNHKSDKWPMHDDAVDTLRAASRHHLSAQLVEAVKGQVVRLIVVKSSKLTTWSGTFRKSLNE